MKLQEPGRNWGRHPAQPRTAGQQNTVPTTLPRQRAHGVRASSHACAAVRYAFACVRRVGWGVQKKEKPEAPRPRLQAPRRCASQQRVHRSVPRGLRERTACGSPRTRAPPSRARWARLSPPPAWPSSDPPVTLAPTGSSWSSPRSPWCTSA